MAGRDEKSLSETVAFPLKPTTGIDGGILHSQTDYVSSQETTSCPRLAPSHQQPGMASSDLVTSDIKFTGNTLTSREAIKQQAQQIIDGINEKRKRDTALLEDFRKALHDQVTNSCNVLEEQMYSVYERSGKNIQSKLQELFVTLDRVAVIIEELDQFKEALGALYSDMEHSRLTSN